MNVKVKEGCRLQAMGYRELFVYDYDFVYEKREIRGFVNVNVNEGNGGSRRGFGEGNQFRKGLEEAGWREAGS